MLPHSISPREMLADLASPQLIVAYCCMGASSAQWCQMQAQSLWNYKIRFLDGGIAAWTHHGGSLIDAVTSQTTTNVHCWVSELAPFFPCAGSGYQVVVTAGCQMPLDLLANASEMRHLRLRNLAWEVRLRYWPSVFCIEAADLLNELSKGACQKYLIVDCRTSEERQVSTLAAPDCCIISADELRARAADYIGAFDTIVTFCTIGGRSGIFCKKVVDELIEAGYLAERADDLRRKFVNLLGGLASWLHNHGGLVDSAGHPTMQLHPWCRAFLDMFPLEGLELVFDEFAAVPQDALSLIACKSASGEKPDAVPQKLLQMCSMVPPEVIRDSLVRAMQNCVGYED